MFDRFFNKLGLGSAQGNAERIQKITQHISVCVGEPESVFHEKVSQNVHIDIHIIKPSDRFPFHVLVTSGMSELPMPAPQGAEEWKFAELYLPLPATWPLSDQAFKDERYYWPIRTLKFAARYPHIAKSWVAPGHTLAVTDGNPPKPLHESIRMNHVAICPPVLLPESFHTLEINRNCTIHFCAVVPIFQEEMIFAKKNRSQDLFDRLKEHGVSELLNPDRQCVIGAS